jgi:hypothetical protein
VDHVRVPKHSCPVEEDFHSYSSQPLAEAHSFMSRKSVLTAECLREECPIPSNVLVKDFAR